MKAYLLCVLGLLVLSVSAVADELTGAYACKGVDTTGAAYTGVATIERSGDAYLVTWKLGKVKYLGIGVRAADVLSVAYYGQMSGVIAYRIDGDKLLGSWAIANTNGKLGSEILTRTSVER